jgi:hypothetical protein
MQITLSPQASSHTTTVALDGLTLIIDGTEYDLSQIPPGGDAALEDSPFQGRVSRESCTILYHYDAALAHPVQSANPADYVVQIESGVVPSPIVWRS